MCGRYSIYEPMDHYLKELAPTQLVINGYDLWPIERYNVAPATRVEIIRAVDDGLRVGKVRWGWSPAWAKGNRPDPINARRETVMSGQFFKDLWPDGRALAPANGWFEWVKDPRNPKHKQPYFIRPKDRRPMFFAALAQVQDEPDANPLDGFVVITGPTDGAMLHIHDRRPLVLSPKRAREWLDPALSNTDAQDIVETASRPTDEFEWFKVGNAVGNVNNQGAHLIERETVIDLFAELET